MDEFINLAKTYTGFDDLDEDWLSQVWLGANKELNIAINHVLHASPLGCSLQTTSTTKPATKNQQKMQAGY